jgi:alanine-glyoxylate transaminase/serine-glyoxylate transaminase/serine-pyruvate transaminase
MVSRCRQEFNPPSRLLMGAGPSNAHPRVLQAMSAPLLGHLDPDFLQLMDDIREMLNDLFRTKGGFCIPVSGTGTAGMEATLVNVLEPGDKIVIATNGFFSDRMVDIARRCGAQAIPIEFEWGLPIDPDTLRHEIQKHPSIKVLAAVHAETSTGVLNPIQELAQIAKEFNALFLVDAVTSLGGVDIQMDNWGIDVCYSGTQKCLACPPGLAPVALSEHAMELIEKRQTPVQSFYLDMTQLRKYWHLRNYHHTAPISMLYALREGLRLLMEEGLENRIHRHAICAEALWAGIQAVGLSFFAQEGHRLPMLTSVRIPENIEDNTVRQALLKEFNIEISGGLGNQSGRIWRIGLMGENAHAERVLYFISCLERVLHRLGYKVSLGAGVTAAQHVLENPPTS